MITQISYRFRVGMFKGTYQFYDSLKSTYVVHQRPKWMPAAGGSFEMWFELFINSSIVDFVKDAFVYNGAYEIAKEHIFKPFVNSLNLLEKANDYPLEIQKYTFFFDDTTIAIYGLTTNFNLIFAAIFSELSKQFEFIKKALNTSNIYEIRIAVDPISGKNDWWIGPAESGPYLSYWGISIDYGVDYIIWDVRNRKKYEGQ